MTNKIFMMLAALLVLATACTDPDKDPFQIDNIKKASIIALRGTAYGNLFEDAFRGAVDTISKGSTVADETFTFDTEYLSDDPSSLREIQVFARLTETGDRKAVKTFPGSTLSIASGATNPTGTITIAANDILNALGKSTGDFADYAYIFIECDLTLNDGSVVPASSITNLSLFESALFYPAHKLRYMVTP